MMTLHEVLAALGYTTAPAGHYRRHIIDADGVTVYTGAAHQVWWWLRETGQIDASCEPVRREGKS